MISHIESQREEDVVPYEHLHLGIFTGVNSHHISINHSHCSTRCRRDEVAVDLEDGSFTQQPLGEVLSGQFAGRLQLLVPVASLARDVLLVPQLRRERWGEMSGEGE